MKIKKKEFEELKSISASIEYIDCSDFKVGGVEFTVVKETDLIKLYERLKVLTDKIYSRCP